MTDNADYDSISNRWDKFLASIFDYECQVS